jgi:hypothetical protein
MIVEKQMECRLAGETEVLGGNLPQRHFCPPQNPTLPDPGLNPGRRGRKPAANGLSYGAALYLILISVYYVAVSKLYLGFNFVQFLNFVILLQQEYIVGPNTSRIFNKIKLHQIRVKL